jgi:pimeloyl-ACP methyl ester carboxylesterase
MTFRAWPYLGAALIAALAVSLPARGLAQTGVGALAAASADAADVRPVTAPRGGFDVASIGSFYIGGHESSLTGLPPRDIVFSPGEKQTRVDPNGTFEAGQMYVQYVKLDHPRARWPLLLWHGGGLTGASWESTPDGRPGWQMFFLKAGYDVYVSDAVERGRASWARYPEIYRTEPFFRTKREAWQLFRIGSNYSDARAQRTAFPGSQFPLDAFDAFSKQFVPRWATNDAWTQAAYDALVQRVCPCIVIAHSQGANFAFTAALHAPGKIKAIVALEPTGAPGDVPDPMALNGIPQLFVWGDNLDSSPFWRSVVKAPLRYRQAVIAAGGTVDTLSLPDHEIRGNSHMLMLDRNSDQIAGLVSAWLDRQLAALRFHDPAAPDVPLISQIDKDN